jgi:isoleucyl-tRNA synthetase
MRVKHRHPLPALHVSGVDAAVLTAHAELLEQEVNVKHVGVLSDADGYVERTLLLNWPDLGKRLKHQVQVLKRAVAAGEYVINPDGTLHAAGVELQPGDFSYRMTAAGGSEAVAAEGHVVVLLDVSRDDKLRMEGDARDLNRVIQDLRKQARLRYSDRIVMSISGNGLEPLLTAFGPWLMEQALAVGLETTPLDHSVAAGALTLDSGSVQVAIRPSSQRD